MYHSHMEDEDVYLALSGLDYWSEILKDDFSLPLPPSNSTTTEYVNTIE